MGRLVKLSTCAVPALLLFSQSCSAVSGSPLGFAPHFPGLPITANLNGGHIHASPPSQPMTWPPSDTTTEPVVPPAPPPRGEGVASSPYGAGPASCTAERGRAACARAGAALDPGTTADCAAGGEGDEHETRSESEMGKVRSPHAPESAP